MLVVQVLREFAVEDFFPTSQESEGFFLTNKLHTRVRTWKPLSPPRKVAPAKESPCAPDQEILFLVHEYLGSERPVSFEYRLLRDFVNEEARCEGSSGNGLPYAARAVP